jgi:glucan-binding YG repeat protein
MKRFLKEMIGIMGLTMFVSSQSPVIAAEASSAKLLAETQISNVQTYAMPTEEQITDQITLIDGWCQDDDGNITYIKGGELVQNQVLEIDGRNYYGFDENGILYVNQSFNMYKSDNGVDYVMACYRAKEDGSLYVNEWYTNQLGNHYYYGQKGEGYSGLHEVDGKTYYFSWGEVCTNQCVSENGKSYYCDPEGSVSDISGDGWHQVGDYYFYIKNGQHLSNTVEKIGNSYYGFDSRGVMYANRDFSIWNFESQMSSDYRAKEDGRLYANEWYTDEWEVFYYYGEDGKAYSGLHEIDGKQYCFSEYCRRYQDQSVTIDGKSYYCKSDGSAIELQNNDWTKVDDHFMYVKDGQALINCVEKIGDSYYGFNYIGVMYANEDIMLRNFEGQISSYYRAKEDGRLYVNEWYVDERVYYFYYGDEGKAASGLTQVDGTLYYFSENGCRYQNEKITVDGRNYYCKSDGEVIELQENGWIKDGENDKYVKDGQVLTDCVEKIGDSYYSFDSTGVMYRNTVLTRWDEATQKYTYYFIKADGRLYVNEWYEYDKYDNHGHGIWYYYGDEGKAASGLTQINGTLYYFSEDGRLYQDQTITVDGKSYYCNLDGIAVELQNNRWTKVDGKYRYVKDGQALTNCVEKIGDFYYGFDSDGYMFADEQFNLLDSESGNTCYYRAHEDGHLYRNEWYMNYKGLWYYFGNDAKMYFGLRAVNGILYYFGSRMYQDESVTVDGKNYYCKSSGEAVELSKNGWNLVDGNYLYVKDGQLLRECLEKIGDAYYYFGYSGVMLSDTTFGLPNTEGEYRVHADGSLYISQWYRINGYWEYYGETGLRKTGWLSLGNIWYYLNEYGWMVTGWQIVDGTWYFFDGSGAMVVGWVNLNGTWYYLSGSGAMVTGWLDLNGTWYYMGADGAMLTGTQVIGGTTYIFNQDGAWVAN